jgi:hypothetical protein
MTVLDTRRPSPRPTRAAGKMTMGAVVRIALEF